MTARRAAVKLPARKPAPRRTTWARRRDAPPTRGGALPSVAGLVPAFESLEVGLLGDLVVDEFIHGEIARVSREAPVLILEYQSSLYAPGGGANAAANLRALGARVRVFGRVGRDEPGRRLLELFEAHRIDRTGIVRDPAYQTPVKTRILAGGAHTSKQQIVRVDRGVTGQPLSRSVGAEILARLRRPARRLRALLVADYGFGAASPAMCAAVKRRPPIVTLDSRFRVLAFRGITAATPNVAEVEQALGRRIRDDDPAGLARAGEQLRRTLGAAAAVITRGSRGMSLFERGTRPLHIPAFGGDEVADVTGAGDTVISAFTLALAAGGTFPQATYLANIAGGLVVMKRGTATVSGEEILLALAQGPPPKPAR